MTRPPRIFTLLTGFAVLAASGCEFWDNEDTAEDDAPQLTSDVTEHAKSQPRPAVDLELKLEPGDRFPLLKTITQTLTQTTREGLTATARSKIELLLSMTVNRIENDGRKLFDVTYHRVRYEQDVAGRKFEFNSDDQEQPVPLEALPYNGLVDNGFSFWVGPDNQIQKPVGFRQFLERCVADVPVEHRQDVFRRFSESSADDGIANFVDDSIGLLPYNVNGREGATVKKGDTWRRKRTLKHPTNIVVDSKYTLMKLTDEIAEIDVGGTVGNSVRTVAADSQSPDVQIQIHGGHVFGQCTIQRATGLPLLSQVDRYVDMTVRTKEGNTFDQIKHIRTRIEAYPQQGVTQTAGAEAGAAR